MKSHFLIAALLYLTACQNRNSKFVSDGIWMDVACKNNSENCTSRFPIIKIDSSFGDSIQVQYNSGKTLTVWSSNKYNATTLTLENNYETLLYPIYDKNMLAYYDGINKKFIYYKKLNSFKN
ncbi:hypothetical protein [Lacihabitans soyangensis]|uniref:Uncharacterized protein n=1 Tax=Lacihabitans soyangensis TaxID=869394 RepID=A0AAE3H985_9BACT|nr:hypothetical protein [Lacihabitans soyangensis]MCP9765945.1 hypothetical protein [Lacihabitans soyangensis]